MIAEDHPVTRIGLTDLLERDAGITVVSQCSRGSDVVPAALRTLPDIALIDLRLPDVDGWAVLAALRVRAPRVKAVAISALDGPDATKRALDAGALAFLHKGASGDQILDTVHRVSRSSQILPETRARLAELPTTEPLTQRELDVLRHLVDGLTNQGIADALGIGVGTVRSHVAHLLDKLGVERRTEAAIVAIRRNLV